MDNKPLIRPYFWGGTLGGVGWLAKSNVKAEDLHASCIQLLEP